VADGDDITPAAEPAAARVPDPGVAERDPEGRALLRAGESVLFIDSKDREYLKTLRAGGRFSLRGGAMAADDIIGTHEGRMVRNPQGEDFLMLRPTFAQLIPNLPRRAQVIYPKDIALILLWGDIGPGMHVLEAGTGPGALTMALLRAVGPTGTVTSCEMRPEFIEMARGNIAQFYGDAPHWTVVECDARAGLPRRGLDRIVLDLPEPWQVVKHAETALRPGGILLSYLPTILQVSTLRETLAESVFGMAETVEILQRGWNVDGASVRPDHRMVAHTGFLTLARKLAPAG